jgi:VanZ family protein
MKMPTERCGHFPIMAILAWIVFSSGLLVTLVMLFRPEPLGLAVPSGGRLVHAIGFFLLIVLAGLATHARSRRFFVIVLAFLVLLAGGSEWIQTTHLLPHRQGDLEDLAADLAGLLIGGAVILMGRVSIDR